mmetsp:Transcript_8928/g.10253  ORF Transcript_8928/g.10253 Transcript_8928/m.10253 type:complete len:644 (-) Transcript_8928:322-2253(-)
MTSTITMMNGRSNSTSSSSSLLFCSFFVFVFVVISNEIKESNSFRIIPNHVNTNIHRRAGGGVLSSLTDTVTEELSITTNESQNRKTAVVVGGGPVGLAAALTLADAPHRYDVTVYESLNFEEYSAFDPAKAYLYLINERGQKFTRKHTALHEKLRALSVPSTSGFVAVPAYPKAIPEPKVFSADPNNKKKASDDSGRGTGQIGNEIAEEPSYWIPRHVFTNMLYETVQEYEQKRIQSASLLLGSITCCFGKKCIGVIPSEDESTIVVHTEGNEETTTIASSKHATLVVAGDGMNSRVRQSLLENNNDNNNPKCFTSIDKNYEPKEFLVQAYTNPDSNLRLKVLLFPSNFTMLDSTTDTDTQVKTTKCSTAYSISGKNTGPKNFLRLGMLPMIDEDAPYRPANAITRPDHEIWNIRTGEEMRLWFEKNYSPRVNFSKEGGIISEAEWDRFAKAEGIRFPNVQYSPKLQISTSITNEEENTKNEKNDCGIVLVGDAAHAFPPSIGQGINSGLDDVIQLDKELTESSDSSNEKKRSLSQALRNYEKKRVPETKSLIRLARFGSPYQYSQPHYIDRIGKALWLSNITFRLLLNKLSFGLIPPPMIMMVMNKALTYRQIARKADTATAGIMAVLTSILIRIFITKRI